MTVPKPRVLIEDWLPVAELGIESRRERAAANAIPPLNSLHIWWARRPVVASAAVVLAGLLPEWSPELRDTFPDADELRDSKSYRKWLLRLIGIWGDPVRARRTLDAANAAGVKLKDNGYGYKQAYKNPIGRSDIALLHRILVHTWGELPVVADVTAGGGSIPWSSSRYGLPTLANDLNGIAAAVLRAGVEVPARHGASLLDPIKQWGRLLCSRVEERLRPYFPLAGGENVVAYIWANAVACPRTGRLVPLMPDKWLRKKAGKEVAVRLITSLDGVELTEPRFEVVEGRAVDKADAEAGYVAGGKGVSPYDNLVIDSQYIKAEAQAGRMSQVMYAVSVKTAGGKREFRSPTQDDLDALRNASDELERLKADLACSRNPPC